MQEAKIKNVLKLTPLQEGLLFLSNFYSEEYGYITVRSFSIKGEFDHVLFERALNQLFDRNDVVRSAIVEGIHEKPIQVILGDREPDYQFVDLTGNSEPKRWIETYKVQNEKRPFNLIHDVLIRFCLVKTAQDKFELIVSWHHIILDGWSVEILFSELAALYSGLKEGRKAKLDKPFQYQKFIEWLNQRPAETATTYWNKYLEGFDQLTPLPFQNQIRRGKRRKRRIINL